MKKGLFSKMVVAYTIIIAVSFVIIATFLSLWFDRYYREQRNNQLISEAELIKFSAVQYMNGSMTADTLKSNITTPSKYSNVDIWLIDKFGYMYSASNEKQEKYIGKQIITDDMEELRLLHRVERTGNFDGIFTTQVHTFEIPIVYNDEFKGAIVMNTYLDSIKAPLRKVYEIIWLSAVIAIILSSIVIYYFSQKIIIKPLAQINCVARKISKGEVSKRVHINSEDEIGELGISFNTMADSLEKVENNRREFISNVSHELRSPITSIKGFISGILDGVVPRDKENYYLSLTYEEINRLTRLVNDLLDLSAIQAGHFTLKMEEINVNEIIRLCVIKFETKIREKKVNVDVCFDEENLYVLSDRDRLTQVITNLVDNAIKYVNESGNIKILAKNKGKKIQVSVFNDGPSIPEEDLKHIWERFYKADKCRTTKASTGLGLPIVRSILTEFGEDIWVESKEGEGAIFTFTLSRIK